MNFLNRLKFYLLGFILGLFLVYGIFKERNWDWLPENKVKKFLLENPLKIFYNKKQDLLSRELLEKNCILCQLKVSFSMPWTSRR